MTNSKSIKPTRVTKSIKPTRVAKSIKPKRVAKPTNKPTQHKCTTYLIAADRANAIGNTPAAAYAEIRTSERFNSEEDPTKEWWMLFRLKNGNRKTINWKPTTIGSELLYVHRPKVQKETFPIPDLQDGPQQLRLTQPDEWSTFFQHTPITYEDICRSSEANTPSPEAS